MAPIDGVTPRLSQETPVLHNSPAMAPRLSRRLARTFLVVSPLVLAALACTPVPSTPTTEADEVFTLPWPDDAPFAGAIGTPAAAAVVADLRRRALSWGAQPDDGQALEFEIILNPGRVFPAAS